MPPKKGKKEGGGKKGKKGKGGKKGKKGKKGAEGPTVAELQNEIIKLMDWLDGEQYDRNLTQIERDRLRDFLEVIRDQLSEKSAEVIDLEAEIEGQEDKHRIQLSMFEQKIKYIQHEAGAEAERSRLDGVDEVTRQEREFAQRELALRLNQRRLKTELKDQQRTHEELVDALRIEFSERESAARKDFERRMSEQELKYEDKLRIQREDLELRRKTEIHEIEERKNSQVKDLVEKHAKAFADMKDYYNTITTNNLSLIINLKDTIEEMKVEQNRLNALAASTAAENKRLRGPLEKAAGEVGVYKKKLQDHEKMRQLFNNTKITLSNTRAELKSSRFENEVLYQQLNSVKKENEQIFYDARRQNIDNCIQVYKEFVGAVHEVHQKSSYRNLLLERKLSGLLELLETRSAEVKELIISSKLHGPDIEKVFVSLEDVIDTKNQMIVELQYEVARVSKAHGDLIKTFQARIAQFGLTPDDCGFVPLEFGTGVYEGRELGLGPAGIISKQM